MTINILHGGVLWDNLVNFIHEIRPDILVLQEVHDSHDLSLEKRFRTMDEFKKDFDWLTYSVFEPTMIEQKTKAPWGNAIFSKFPINSTNNYLFGDRGVFEYDFIRHDEDPSAVTEGMIEGQIDIEGKKVFVYSWHGVWDRHGSDTEKRFEMEKVIVDAIYGKQTVILAGDTNLNPDTQFVENLKNKLQLKNVFGNELTSTFNMRHKTNPGYATAVVDMIFVSKDIGVIKKEMPQVDVSDHFPLYAELEV